MVQECKETYTFGSCFPTVHISLVKDQVTLKGVQEINIGMSRVAKSSNLTKGWTEIVGPIHTYVRA